MNDLYKLFSEIGNFKFKSNLKMGNVYFLILGLEDFMEI